MVMPNVYPVTGHTDFVGPGSVYVAIAGKSADGHNYIEQAVHKGATEIVVDESVLLHDSVVTLCKQRNVCITPVQNPRKVLAQRVAQAYGYPAQKLKIIGITGTKGKTSTSYLLYKVLRAAGYKTALLSTIQKRIDTAFVSLDLTTPLPDHLHAFLHMCVQHNIEYVVMEVSAQALSLHRVEGLQFDAGIFTNFSLEHLEFYADLDAYFQAKCLFVHHMKDVQNWYVNADDEHGQKIIRMFPEVTTFGKRGSVSFQSGMKNNKMEIVVSHHHVIDTISTYLLGDFNAYNVVAVLSVAMQFGITMQTVQKAFDTILHVPGRMERYELQGGGICFIDYAHNPSSFQAVLSTLRTLKKRMIVVFGAGGNRDKSKRPMMGALVEKYADCAVLTSDNPRDERASDIVHDILQGVSPDTKLEIVVELNRTTAIQKACRMATQDTVVAILGKGQDEYQVVGVLTFPFKERSIIKPYLAQQALQI